MKKVVLIILVVIFCFSFYFLPSSTVVATAKQPTKVYHLFTHALVAYPKIAFDKDNEMAIHYDRDCLTVSEFKQILSQLYSRNYILVSPNDIYYFQNGNLIFKDIDFGNKKPLILSFDDINYYTKKMHLGMNDKIILSDKKLATFTQNADKQINYDNEVVTILENFLTKHPDFSYNNAKGTLCLTGFDGVLGYRTQQKSANRAEEIEKVKPVIAELKRLNWKFACHSYGHYHMKNISYAEFIKDTDAWLSEVKPLVGETDIYCYPFGEYDIETNNTLSPKQKYLMDNGFAMFWGVGGQPFWGDMPINKKIDTKFSLMDRVAMDGYTLKNRDMSLYYNNKEVIDSQRIF